MKKISVEFEEEKEREDIRIVFHASAMDEEVRRLMKRLNIPFHDSLTVYDEYGASVLIPQEHMISIASDNRKLRVTAEEGVFEMRSSLREVQEQLNDMDFLKISRYEIINLHQIKRFDFPISGSLRIEMKNGMVTWVSRRNIAEIRKRLMRKDAGR